MLVPGDCRLPADGVVIPTEGQLGSPSVLCPCPRGAGFGSWGLGLRSYFLTVWLGSAQGQPWDAFVLVYLAYPCSPEHGSVPVQVSCKCTLVGGSLRSYTQAQITEVAGRESKWQGEWARARWHGFCREGRPFRGRSATRHVIFL